MRIKGILVGIGGSLLLALAVSGCSKGQKAEQPQAPPQAAATQLNPAQPQAQAEVAAGPQFPLTGKVEETFDSGGYTYVRMKAADGEHWVAAPQTTVKVGDDVTVEAGQMMHNFESRTLNRTFEDIIFTTGLGGKAKGGSFAAALKNEKGQAADPAAMMGSSKAIVPAADVKVEKAPGPNGYRVGDLFAQAAKLDGKEVEVRGKVMKVSPNIMGRNWIHLQDGTGNPQQNTHDLVVTSTTAQPANGEVVTVKGVLHANKDFGAGYKYAAIVEDAEVLK
ncbi:MAG: DNA-binding protein [Desulfobacteraceae bacterium]|nr:DNA-binding protein [Desulfobacteraceae bacterium]